MKFKSIILVFTLGLCWSFSTYTFAQVDSTRLIQERKTAAEASMKLNQEIQQNEAEKRAERLKDAVALEKENKAIAKETNRVNKDASYAARESKLALKAEQKAQKNRIKADRLAAKAAKATQKSNQN